MIAPTPPTRVTDQAQVADVLVRSPMRIFRLARRLIYLELIHPLLTVALTNQHRT